VFEVILSLWFRKWERIGELGILVQCLVQVNSRGQLDVKSGGGRCSDDAEVLSGLAVDVLSNKVAQP
jgi:hypothetical protein